MTDQARLAARFFPNTGQGAYYSHRDLAVHLPDDEMDGARVNEAAYREDWIFSRLPTLVHEYQHSVDHLGTVVGRSLLDGLAGAIAGLEQKMAGDVSGLPLFVAFHDAEQRFARTSYFTEVSPTYRVPSGKRPRWSWASSVGAAFDHDGRINEADPLFFLRFTDVDLKVLVSRQPITAASLFETRSVYVELDHDIRFTALRLGEDVKGWAEFNARQGEMFYDPRLTRYSAPAHMVSSRCGDGDPIEAYKAAAFAAGVALNISPALDLNLRIPEELAQQGSAARLQKLIGDRDPGFLFVVIVMNAPRTTPNVLEWLEPALKGAGFPPLATIVDAADTHLRAAPTPLKSMFDGLHRQVAQAGAENFRRLHSTMGLLDFEVMQKVGTAEGPFALPNVILKRDMLGPITNPVLARMAQIDVGRLSSLLDGQMSEFLAACR